METIKDFLFYAIEEGHTLLAHSLFIAIQNKLVAPEESIDDLDLRLLNASECIAAEKENILNIHPVRLYAVKCETDFAMYFAHNTIEVKNEHYKKFKVNAFKIFDMTEKMHTDIFDEQTCITESFYDIQKRTVELPCFVCMMMPRRK